MSDMPEDVVNDAGSEMWWLWCGVAVEKVGLFDLVLVVLRSRLPARDYLVGRHPHEALAVFEINVLTTTSLIRRMDR